MASFSMRSCSDALRLSVMKRSGVGGSRGIGGRLAKSATAPKRMKRRVAGGRDETRAESMTTSGAEHERTCTAVAGIVRPQRAAADPRSTAMSGLLMARQRARYEA